MMHLYQKLNQTFHDKRYEPVERNHDGVRFHSHRFPIKGGISFREVMIRKLSKPNRLLEMIRAKGG